jgi:hypothetical protein
MTKTNTTSKKPATSRSQPEKHELLPLADEKLREFVLRYCDGKIYTHHDVPEQQLHFIFMPLALGALEGWTETELKQIGCIYGDMKDASGPSINGRPVFFTCQLMRVDDWARARAAIEKELARRKTIEV